MSTSNPERILLVTGMSGAGKSTVLDTLEDMGWEVVDNLPFQLLDRLLATRAPAGTTGERPLALGIDSRTRGFDADQIVARVNALPDGDSRPISMLFVDCAGSELERRYSETRRRHPLAADRPAKDGIASERELVAPLRRWAEHVIDTTASTTNALKQEIRTRFGDWGDVGMNIAVLSFGYARGLPRNADLIFDMRFLRNPHWDAALRPLTGLDPRISRFIEEDPAYEDVVRQIEGLLLTLLPRYGLEGKAYVTIAFGCTGGRHRSVHVAERVARHLANHGFTPILSHRDIEAAGDSAGKEDESGAQASPTQ